MTCGPRCSRTCSGCRSPSSPAPRPGALISRLNNDVLGAQQAFTDTLSNVVSNLLSVTLVIAAMLFLSWQITLISLVLLPIFVIPARLLGSRLQAITREGYGLNAEMNTMMTERFNVSGALLVKLFGRPQEEDEAFRARAGRVRDIGVQSADVRADLLRRADPGGRAGHRDHVRRRRTHGRRGIAEGRHAGRADRLPRPAVRTADRAEQRAGRHHDGAGQLRAGLRGARPPAGHR